MSTVYGQYQVQTSHREAAQVARRVTSLATDSYDARPIRTLQNKLLFSLLRSLLLSALFPLLAANVL
jgi:hypothetical protein